MVTGVVAEDKSVVGIDTLHISGAISHSCHRADT